MNKLDNKIVVRCSFCGKTNIDIPVIQSIEGFICVDCLDKQVETGREVLEDAKSFISKVINFILRR